MSNDQPTERFDAQNGDAPTKRFDAQGSDAPTVRFEPAGGMPTGAAGGGPVPPGSGEPPTPFSEPEGKSRTLLIILAIVGGLLLIALVIALTLMATRGSGDSVPVATSPTPSTTASESPSPEPSETEPEPEESAPEPEPTTAPPPPAESPSFATFSAPESAMCTAANPTSQLTFSWSSTDAVAAWIGVATTNAKAAPYEEVPTTATYTIDYQCSNDSEVYTVTLEDSVGNLAHETVTVTKN
ncbi:hypothetical protein [Salinibacterium sp. SWN1162]|uniref:hypothetical protein n=1 Tax=Salinibacterium sp. SWN1162 TaxID=2792053 RepID=UPI0018CEBCD8|nr:hypothetical protein [Salinibacterium sp. SWN1162]MBH0009065.1 hypothetical protein [Salinibacterium sp. SWN1162]